MTWSLAWVGGTRRAVHGGALAHAALRGMRKGKSGRAYTVVVERDPGSGWLVGEVVELPDCCTQARDLGALERNVREAARAYLKTVQAAPPVPESVGTWRVEVAP